MASFDARVLERLRLVEEVRIVTSRAPSAEVHRTIIWIVVDEDDRVLVRSVRGQRGRWYRELVANREGALLVDGSRIEVRAEPAKDPDRIGSASRVLTAKYASDPGLKPMLRDDVLDTTLELRPR